MSVELIEKYFPNISSIQKIQLEGFEKSIKNWNQKINLISRKDIEQLWVRHILHSLSLVKCIDFSSVKTILDVGTGGGFPGVPLAIFFQEIDFFLLDSTQKKLHALSNIMEELKLTNIKIIHTRVENHDGKYDLILSRAVSSGANICKWTRHLFKDENKKRWALLKGGDIEKEMKKVQYPYTLFHLSEYFREPFFETKKIVSIFSQKKELPKN